MCPSPITAFRLVPQRNDAAGARQIRPLGFPSGFVSRYGDSPSRPMRRYGFGEADQTRTACPASFHRITIGVVVSHREPESGMLSAGAEPRRRTYALASSTLPHHNGPCRNDGGGYRGRTVRGRF